MLIEHLRIQIIVNEVKIQDTSPRVTISPPPKNRTGRNNLQKFQVSHDIKMVIYYNI